jgi:hypothetical protein
MYMLLRRDGGFGLARAIPVILRYIVVAVILVLHGVVISLANWAEMAPRHEVGQLEDAD